jgi:hypothetical protein
VKPETKNELDISNKEVGLFNLQITVRKPLCSYTNAEGVVSTNRSDINIYILTDPDGRFSIEKKNQTKDYKFQQKYLSIDGVEKLHLSLTIEQ